LTPLLAPSLASPVATRAPIGTIGETTGRLDDAIGNTAELSLLVAGLIAPVDEPTIPLARMTVPTARTDPSGR